MPNSQTVKFSASAGGEVVETPFIRVVFQKGFPAQVGVNGCRVQDVIDIAVNRLHEYQQGPLACVENDEALHHLRQAISALERRIQRRQEQGVLNTFSPHEVRTEDEEEDFSATGA